MKRQSLHLTILVSVLLVLAAAVTWYQHAIMGLPWQPEETTQIWTIDANVTYESAGRPVRVALNIPSFRHGYAEISERFISDNYGLMMQEDDSNRQAVWSIRRPKGDQTLYYRTIVRREDMPPEEPPKNPAYAGRAVFENDIEKLAAESLIGPIRSRSADVETFVSETIKRLGALNDNNAQVLLRGDTTIQNKAELVVKLLSLAHIPTEIFHVLPLTSSPDVVPLVWLRTHNGKKWLYFDPATGNASYPRNSLPWWWGDKPVYDIQGAKNPHIKFSVTGHAIDQLELAKITGMMSDSLAGKLSLYSLPVQTQHVYAVLLAVPLGVIVILFLRAFVGIKTFGTFTPILIALAFRETQLMWGIILFVVVTACGLLIRTYLENLRLLLIPRLGIVLTCVIFIMLLISEISHQLGFERGLSIALFPMVILTGVIERMSIMWEERGATDAIKTGGGSLLAASLAYLVMNHERVVYVVFTFPFLLFGLIALMVALGRYSGYRLSELKRFKAFLREDISEEKPATGPTQSDASKDDSPRSGS